jgi:hypothetical protein
MTDRVETYIDANRSRFIEELEQWMRFPSVSVHWLSDHLRGLGFESQLVDIDSQSIRLTPMPPSGTQWEPRPCYTYRRSFRPAMLSPRMPRKTAPGTGTTFEAYDLM